MLIIVDKFTMDERVYYTVLDTRDGICEGIAEETLIDLTKRGTVGIEGITSDGRIYQSDIGKFIGRLLEKGMVYDAIFLSNIGTTIEIDVQSAEVVSSNMHTKYFLKYKDFPMVWDITLPDGSEAVKSQLSTIGFLEKLLKSHKDDCLTITAHKGDRKYPVPTRIIR